jgi:anaerobic dimethyl sulfoxide reductase subunit C (anchor subunit)
MAIQWALVIFTLLICLASGIFAGAGLLAVFGKGQKLQVPAVIAALLALVIGGVASFMHLEHWNRAFNGFGNISSGITQELIGIVVFFIVLVIYFVVSRNGETPKWAGVLAIIVGVGLVIVMSTSYMMPARPVWATVALYVFYLAQMVAAGGAALWLISSAVGVDDATVVSARITAIGGVLVIVSLVIYAGYISAISSPTVGYYFDPTDPTKEMQATTGFGLQLLSGSLAIYFWGAVVVGGAIAAVLGFLRWRRADGGLPLAAIALVCTLAGGVAFRAALYILGVSIYAFY